ncbi:MAG: metal-dependent hydrolase [Thermoanaerobaculia bacterium]|nr:metal-dependent hydrolase [Thermoanaerobaculia bacterium]
MDPICHTLVGATLAGTRLGDRCWGAKATLIVAANLPDVDVVSLAWGQNASMAWRRGWTHGVLALAVAPFLLAWLVGWWGRRRGREVSQSWLLGLSYLGFLTHPTLDWLNTYGMRWLMPFDGTWFYGDALYIVDPWMWLIPGAAAFLRFSRGRRAVGLWLVLGLLLSVPIVGFAPAEARWPWLIACTVLVAVRARGPLAPATARSLCVVALGLVVAYAATMAAQQRLTRNELVVMTGKRPAEVFVGPLPGRVTSRDVLLAGPHTYTPGIHHLSEPELETLDAIAIESDDVRVLSALLAPCAEGIANWLRYPFFRIEETTDGGSRVHLLDARYVRSVQPGFGMWTVEFDAEGNVVSCP